MWLMLKPVCCKKRREKVQDQLLVCTIGDLWRNLMIPNWFEIGLSEFTDDDQFGTIQNLIRSNIPQITRYNIDASWFIFLFWVGAHDGLIWAWLWVVGACLETSQLLGFLFYIVPCNDCLKTAWRLPDDCLKTAWQLLDDCIT